LTTEYLIIILITSLNNTQLYKTKPQITKKYEIINTTDNLLLP
jgi:hypothetical protein